MNPNITIRNCPTWSQQYFLFLNKVVLSPFAIWKTETMEAGSSHERQPMTHAAPTIEKFEVQFSEACHKNVIIFDHSARNRTMLLHPAFMYDHSSFVSMITNKRCDLFAHLQSTSDKAVENTLNIYPPPADPSIRGARLLAYRETMESAFAALQKMKTDGFSSFGSNAGDGVMAAVQGAPEKSEVSGNGLYEDYNDGIQSQHEDTEELDALLSSDDDELDSTGHSPSEATGSNVPTCSDDRKDLSASILSKKRKFEMCDPEDDGADFSSNEADSSQVLLSN